MLYFCLKNYLFIMKYIHYFPKSWQILIWYSSFENMTNTNTILTVGTAFQYNTSRIVHLWFLHTTVFPPWLILMFQIFPSLPLLTLSIRHTGKWRNNTFSNWKNSFQKEFDGRFIWWHFDIPFDNLLAKYVL